MRNIFKVSIALLLVQSSIAFAQTEGDFKLPDSVSQEGVDEALAKRQPYYVGMTKEALYKVYPSASQQNYYAEGNEEWIVFDDTLTSSDLKDIITFYLKEGKVAGWDKKSLPKTPEERLKTIQERYKQKVSYGDYGGGGDDMDYKRRAREQNIKGSGNQTILKKYLGY